MVGFFRNYCGIDTIDFQSTSSNTLYFGLHYQIHHNINILFMHMNETFIFCAVKINKNIFKNKL